MRIKTLAVLVNYGDEQLDYLDQVVKSLKNFKKYKVTVIVNSNIPINNDLIDFVNIFKLDDYQLLPLTCRTTIWNNKNGYDLFIYGENDHLFKEIHLDKHLEYSNILPDSRITGLIQYEEAGNSTYYPGYHGYFEWNYKSVEVYDGKKFAHFNNVHQATFILTKNQLDRVISKFDFKVLVNENTLKSEILRKIRKLLGLKVDRINKYSVKCKVNTDVFLYGGMKKMICISEFEDNLIHHLPNLYIDGKKGRNKLRATENQMNKALKKLHSL